jgi:hypothetical protein
MAETIFEITRPLLATSARFVGRSRHSLKPGQKVDIPRSKLDSQIVLDVANGEFTSLPVMKRDESIDENPTDLAINALVKMANDANTEFIFPVDPVVGASGQIKIDAEILVRDGDHVNDVVNRVADGLRVQLNRTVGSAQFDTPAGGTTKIVTLKDGRASFTLAVAAPITQAQTITLTDVDATGLAVADTLTVNFNL